jgi:diketogulonate reductase-like aldo/keto reductase
MQRGLARHIGVSSFSVAHLQLILDLCQADPTVVPPALNQIEIHPFIQQHDLLAYMQEHDIALEGFASLLPLTFSPSSPEEEAAQNKLISCAAELAKKHGAKGPSPVLMRYAMDRGAVIVTTSSKRDRLEGYITDTQGFVLSAEDMAALETAAGQVQMRGFFAEEFADFESGKSLVV